MTVLVHLILEKLRCTVAFHWRKTLKKDKAEERVSSLTLCLRKNKRTIKRTRPPCVFKLFK